jgi:hypothetical protein
VKACQVVEHAVLADLTSPSLVAITQMEAGEWEEDPDVEEIPDDAQMTQAQRLRAGIEFFADYGYPQNSFCTINALRDGIWEFKKGRIRVSFYDTDGAGGWTPKGKHIDRANSDDPDDEQFWWLPRFDDMIRLGHCFGKTTQVTEEEDIEMTLRVRLEDTAHDRP